MTVNDLIAQHRRYQQQGVLRRPAARIDQLRRLRQMLVDGEADFLAALQGDLGKPPIEAYASELGFVISDIDYAIRQLPKWMRRRRVPAPRIAAPARAWLSPEPLGVALIIGPWNYPLQLLLAPLVGALAAGCCACLKPSEYAPRTADAIARHIQRTFHPAAVSIVCGDATVAAALLQARFDKIFFTGSSRVGRLVMRAAAEHLTPVTLELGGKSPCIVCEDAKLDLAARSILWGKCLNAGQTCVSPDYLLVDQRIEDDLCAALRSAFHRFYPDGAAASTAYGRIINATHFKRLVSYLEQGEIVMGGAYDERALFIEPTVLKHPALDAPVMQEEIFGPILPVISYRKIDDVFALLAPRPKPLALYLFTESGENRSRVLDRVAAGGVAINDTITHIVGKALPFGGVGESGMGQYHGKAGFDAFTHAKPVLRRATWIEPPFRYPPTTISLDRLKRIYRYLVNS